MMLSSKALLACFAAGLSVSCALGQAGRDAPQLPVFAVAAIKPSKSAMWQLQPTPDGYTATGVTLRMLVQEAYGLFDDKLLSGGPPWFDADRFDLKAKVDSGEAVRMKDLTYRQRADMLRALLADRFQLKVRSEVRTLPVLNLVVGKGGPRLKPTSVPGDGMGVGISCHILQNRPGYTDRRDCSVTSLEDLLRSEAGKPVIDKTGLTGRYDFDLRWRPESTSSTGGDEPAPFLFHAVQEQLGLKLEPSTAPLKVLVVEQAERPSEN